MASPDPSPPDSLSPTPPNAQNMQGDRRPSEETPPPIEDPPAPPPPPPPPDPLRAAPARIRECDWCGLRFVGDLALRRHWGNCAARRRALEAEEEAEARWMEELGAQFGRAPGAPPGNHHRVLQLNRTAMAQSVPPGDIQTQPNAKIVFNAPYDDKHTYHIKVINSSARRIGYAIKTTNMKRLGVDPPCGVLDPKEAVLLAVSCDAFAFGQEDTNNDRITVEWTNTPDGAAKQFRREWFQGDGMVRRKNLPIEYNP